MSRYACRFRDPERHLLQALVQLYCAEALPPTRFDLDIATLPVHCSVGAAAEPDSQSRAEHAGDSVQKQPGADDWLEYWMEALLDQYPELMSPPDTTREYHGCDRLSANARGVTHPTQDKCGGGGSKKGRLGSAEQKGGGLSLLSLLIVGLAPLRLVTLLMRKSAAWQSTAAEGPGKSPAHAPLTACADSLGRLALHHAACHGRSGDVVLTLLLGTPATPLTATRGSAQPRLVGGHMSAASHRDVRG